jgi:hypothetical protein
MPHRDAASCPGSPRRVSDLDDDDLVIVDFDAVKKAIPIGRDPERINAKPIGTASFVRLLAELFDSLHD